MTSLQMTMDLATDDPVTMYFDNGVLLVILDFRQDRHAALDLSHKIRGFSAVQSVDTHKDNCTYTVHFRSVTNLESVKSGIRELAQRHIDFWASNPLQAALFSTLE